MVRNRLILVAPILFHELVFYRRVFGAVICESNSIEYRDHPPDLERRDTVMARIQTSNCWNDVECLYNTIARPLNSIYKNFLDYCEENSGFRREMITVDHGLDQESDLRPLPQDLCKIN